MAVTVTIDQDIQLADGQGAHLYRGSLLWDSSYPTGGETLDVAGNETFRDMWVSFTAGYGFEFLPSSQKCKAYRQKDPGNAGGADIPLVEVANAVDLSAVTARFIAIGS